MGVSRHRRGSLGLALVLGVAAAAAPGCGGGGDPAATHNVKIDVGGVVRYALGDGEALSGVAITLVDIDGEVWTATTNSAGLWTIENLKPGVYVEEYALSGYLTASGTFSIPAGGENNVKNVFITRPDVFLEEVPMTASISPFEVTLVDGDEIVDGLAGATLVYSSSADAAIVVTFSRRVANGFVRIRDGETGEQIFAEPNADFTVFTFTEDAIGSVQQGGGGGGQPGDELTLDQDPFTWHQLEIGVSSYTPIHGDLVDTDADAWFNATP